MITRLVPLFPYNLQNFAYGVTDIKFSLFYMFSDFYAARNGYVYGWNSRTCRQREPDPLYRVALVLAVVVRGLVHF